MTQGPDINVVAVQWSARFERGLTEAEADALAAWLEADVRHYGAYARARAAAVSLQSLEGGAVSGQGAHIQALRQSSTMSRRAALCAGLVATVGAVGAGAFLWRKDQTYRTGLGEVREFRLDDGSHLTLSAQSSVSVRIYADRRDVVMTAGEALVDVARAERPFRLFSAGTEIVAHSGRVLVRRYAQDPLQITPLDADVQIETPEEALRVSAGEGVAVGRHTYRMAMDAEDVARALAWREGQLALHDDPLAEAAKRFARFSPVALKFDSAHTASLRITGLFDVRDPVTFARAAALSLGLSVLVGERHVTLLQ